MQPRIAKISITFVLALALGVAGCGGDDDDQPALTKAQFIKQADAICKKADEVQFQQLAKVLKGSSGAGQITPDKKQAALQAGLLPIQQQAEEIRELGAPAGDEAKIEAIVDGIEEAVKKAEEGSVEDLNRRKTSPFKGVDKLSAAYGFKECAEAL